MDPRDQDALTVQDKVDQELRIQDPFQFPALLLIQALSLCRLQLQHLLRRRQLRRRLLPLLLQLLTWLQRVLLAALMDLPMANVKVANARLKTVSAPEIKMVTAKALKFAKRKLANALKMTAFNVDTAKAPLPELKKVVPPVIAMAPIAA
jgi:hypothetical protein